MTDITANQHWLIEEDVFGFFRGDAMAFPVLVRVRLVPFEPGARSERVFAFRHNL